MHYQRGICNGVRFGAYCIFHRREFLFCPFDLFPFNTRLLFSSSLGLGFVEYGLSQRIMFTTEPNLSTPVYRLHSTLCCWHHSTLIFAFLFFCSLGLLFFFLLYSLLVLLTVWSFLSAPTSFSNSVSSNFVYIPSRIDTVDARFQDNIC